jgi:hypothetical protein
MRYGVILVVLLVIMCIGQEEAPELAQEPNEGQLSGEPPEEELSEEEPIPDDLIRSMIVMYFEALNQRNLATLESLTHPFYAEDVQPLLEYIDLNDLSFEIVAVSFVVDEEDFRELTQNLSDEEFAQQVGRRGLSYELELIVTQGDKIYEEFFLFMEVGETDEGWKVLDPYLLQLVIEAGLEVIQSQEE